MSLFAELAEPSNDHAMMTLSTACQFLLGKAMQGAGSPRAGNTSVLGEEGLAQVAINAAV
jgi:hypothetical protein